MPLPGDFTPFAAEGQKYSHAVKGKCLIGRASHHSDPILLSSNDSKDESRESTATTEVEAASAGKTDLNERIKNANPC